MSKTHDHAEQLAEALKNIIERCNDNPMEALGIAVMAVNGRTALAAWERHNETTKGATK